MPEFDQKAYEDKVRREARDWDWRSSPLPLSGTHHASRYSEDIDPNDDPIDHDPLGRREEEFAPEERIQPLDRLFR